MAIDNVIGELTPDPDGQFRLKSCRICRGGNAKYVHYNARGGAAWKTVCPDCGHTVDKGHRVRHDAQAAWNKEDQDEIYQGTTGNADAAGAERGP